MIVLDNIQKHFILGDGTSIQALNNINIAINKGDFVTIIGSNGSGKSTLIKLVSGIEQPTSGNILLNGVNITSTSVEERSKYVAQVFQNPELGVAPNLSILENFRLAFLRGKTKSLFSVINNNFKKQIKDRIATLNMGLENKLNIPIGMLSGGQRQALCLLMATLAPCELLLMDEPTAALDPINAALVLETANNIVKQNNLTCLYITHNMHDAIKYGNRLIQLQNGNVIKDIDKTTNPVTEILW